MTASTRLVSRQSFLKSVYELVLKVPEGRVTTYGAIAKELGMRKASRAIGSALRRNPLPIAVPCHRVVMSNGRLGGYFSAAGVLKKKSLLEKEGVVVKNFRVDLLRYFFDDF